MFCLSFPTLLTVFVNDAISINTTKRQMSWEETISCSNNQKEKSVYVEEIKYL